MINIIKDVDLRENLDGYDAILIGTNTYCTMSHGMQLYVMLNYPYVYEKNLETKYADPEKLGTIIECKSENEPTFCLCFITNSYNFRPYDIKDFLSYESLEKCLKLVNILYKGKKVATTLMGASKFDGNGDREKIFEIFNSTITDVDLTIYDYYQKLRDEELVELLKEESKVKKKDRDAYYKMVRERKKIAEDRFKKNGHRRY